MDNTDLFACSEALEQSPAEASALIPPTMLLRGPAPLAQPTKQPPLTPPSFQAVRRVTHAATGAL